MWGQPPPAVRRAQFDSQSREAAQEYSPRREPWESKPEEGKGSERSCLPGAGKDPVMLSEAEGKRSDPPAKSKHPCPLLAPRLAWRKPHLHFSTAQNRFYVTNNLYGEFQREENCYMRKGHTNQSSTTPPLQVKANSLFPKILPPSPFASRFWRNPPISQPRNLLKTEILGGMIQKNEIYPGAQFGC